MNNSSNQLNPKFVEQVAIVAHQTNKAFCETIGDHSQKNWNEAEQWQRDSAIRGVEYAMTNPNAPASAQHDAWKADKEKDGWKYGLVKDPAKKEHPCMVEYDQLPEEQQAKDHLFKAIVNALAPFVKEEGIIGSVKAEA